MSGLAQLAEKALANPASQPAIEFAKPRVTWGELCQLADRVAALLAASRTASGDESAIVARNHPSASVTLIALIAQCYCTRLSFRADQSSMRQLFNPSN